MRKPWIGNLEYSSHEAFQDTWRSLNMEDWEKVILVGKVSTPTDNRVLPVGELLRRAFNESAEKSPRWGIMPPEA